MKKIRLQVKENLAGAGTSGDGGMSAPFSAMGQEIDSRRKRIYLEGVPTYCLPLNNCLH